MSSFAKQLALSAAIMGGLIAGLYFLGKQDQSRSVEAPSASILPATSPGSEPTQSQPANARALLPARASLVVDFEGRLTGTSPFGATTGACAQVPPPARVGLAIGEEDGALPGVDGRTGLTAGGAVLFLVSPAVTPEFWGCVRSEVLAAGGQLLPGGEADEALESPSGVVLHSRGRLLFASDRRLIAELRALASGRAPSAASVPPHPALVSGLAQEGSGERTAPLVATLHFREDWLADLGPEALKTPLRHLKAGALRADADGGATGTLECAEPGCEELAAFLVRARSDLGRLLPGPLGEKTVQSWTASLARGAGGRGVIQLRWVPHGMTFADWASGIWAGISSRGLP